ncbi:tetratricopeptide repeat protein [Gloeobacter violaceus]|uniref:Glr0772 protein n=1 Tax=Gloeobacter violaceus (strain ATCC 29082 / PCC 7421) TaxID=251221 RepID=Q7NMJ3_GLOVI|nr:tetratricopeptide repeat protein [Gloeobacter violaceus]BAC88713.1 glr0772 [Gloeobacter violaceus PCC 7421]
MGANATILSLRRNAKLAQTALGRYLPAGLALLLLALPATAQSLAERERNCTVQKRGLTAGRNRHLNACTNYGWTLHLAGREGEAIAVLAETARLVPNDEKPLNALGVIYLFTEAYPQAVAVNRQAIRLKADNEIAYYNLSLGLWELGRYEEAARAAREAARLDPRNPHPKVAVAIAEARAGRFELARQAYREAIGLDRRYRRPAYLEQLRRSDFSVRQVTAARAVLKSLGNSG